MVVKGYDTLLVKGWLGYNPRIHRRFQCEQAFMRFLWETENDTLPGCVNGVAFPTIYVNTDDLLWIYEQVVPVTLRVTVTFGVPRYKEMRHANRYPNMLRRASMGLRPEERKRQPRPSRRAKAAGGDYLSDSGDSRSGRLLHQRRRAKQVTFRKSKWREK